MSTDPFENTPAPADDPFAGTPPDSPADEPTPEAPQAPQEAAQPPTEPVQPTSASEAPRTPEDPGTGDVTPAVPTQPDATPSQEPESGSNGRTGPRGGKGDMRHYKLLYQTGPLQWTEFDLTTVPDDAGIQVVKVDEEQWFEARNNEHANRLGFTIVGRPKEGARIFPVPRGAYKPKRVAPAPPKPERERVVIS